MALETWIAAGAAACSAFAAWKSWAVASTALRGTEEARRREAMFELARTAREVVLAADRAVELLDEIGPQVDSLAVFHGAFDGGGHKEMRDRVAKRREKVEDCMANASAVEDRLPILREAPLEDLAEPLARMHARVAEMDSLLTSLRSWEQRNAADIHREIERTRNKRPA